MAMTCGIYWQPDGNTKVDCAIISASSACDCVNRAVCPFSPERHEDLDLPECYGFKAERRFIAKDGKPGLREKRNVNITAMATATVADIEALAAEISRLCKKRGIDYVRYNETGDISPDNVRFFELLTVCLNRYGITPFTYSKSAPHLVQQLRDAGCVVLVSETDFVCVQDAEEAKSKGLALCPGEGCGKSCVRCCKGLQSAVVAH